MQQPDTTVNLGQFQFALFEIPNKISWGGSQRLAVHELVGGQRIIDAMGRSDRALEWSGLFVGLNATERARFLDTMRAQGLPQALTFGQLSYSVIVKEFDADYERYYQIPYRISCEVVADLANPVTTVSPASIDSDILTDYSAANLLAGQIADANLLALMATAGLAISAIASFANIPGSALSSVRGPLAAVQSRVGVLVGISSLTLSGAPSFGGVAPGASGLQSAIQLTAQSNNMLQLNTLLQLNSIVGRMSANLGAVANAPNTLTLAGGNLFGVASQQYGDASAWTGIAKANNLNDPFVQGVQTLNIPAQPDNAGGVLVS